MKRLILSLPHQNRMTDRKKCVVFLLLLILFVLPFEVHSKDERGIKISTHDTIWGNYHALIIGINSYQEWRTLQTAVKDAEGLKDMLVNRYGFAEENVTIRTDQQATRRNIINDLRRIALNLRKMDNLLIYYGGHGQIDNLTGGGYWIPVDGKLKDPSTWISHSIIKSILSSERFEAKNVILVVDSCYSGSLLRGGPSLLSLTDKKYEKKLKEAASLRSRQVITSGGIEPVTDGGKDGHSLFAYYLLKALKNNDRYALDLENLFHTCVWEPVTEIGGQRPNVGRFKTPMDDEGQFVLVNRANPFLEDKKKRIADDRAQKLQERLNVLMEEKQELEDERKHVEIERQILVQKRLLVAERIKIAKEKQKLDRYTFESEKQILEQKKQIEPQHLEMEKEKEKIALIPIDTENQKIEEEKKKLAFIPKTEVNKKNPALSEDVRSDFQFKLAIFPWALTTGFIEKKERFVEAFTQILIANPLFVPIYSSYELGEKFKAKKFDDDIMANLTDDKLWLKKPFFSKFKKSSTMEDFLTKEPNVDYICQVGKKLKVDAVLMYNTVSLDPFNPRIIVVLIGVNDGKCYTEKDTGYFWTRKRLLAGLKKVTEKVFKNFQENNLHSQLGPHTVGNLLNNP